MKTPKSRAGSLRPPSCRRKYRFHFLGWRKDELIQGKLRIRSLPGAFLVLGAVVVAAGTVLAVAGYWPYRSPYGGGQSSDTSDVDTTGLLSSSGLLHRDRMKLLGPVIVGVGLFILICANTVLYENRDRETQMLLVQMSSVVCSVSAAVPSAGLGDDPNARRYRWVSSLPATHLHILNVSEPLLQSGSTRDQDVPKPLVQTSSTRGQDFSEPLLQAGSTKDQDVPQPLVQSGSTRDQHISEPLLRTKSTNEQDIREPLFRTRSTRDQDVPEPLVQTMSTRERDVPEPLLQSGSTNEQDIHKPLFRTRSTRNQDVSQSPPQPSSCCGNCRTQTGPGWVTRSSSQTAPLLQLSLGPASSMSNLRPDDPDVLAAVPRRCQSVSHRIRPQLVQAGLGLKAGLFTAEEDRQLEATGGGSGSQVHQSGSMLDLGGSGVDLGLGWSSLDLKPGQQSSSCDEHSGSFLFH